MLLPGNRYTAHLDWEAEGWCEHCRVKKIVSHGFPNLPKRVFWIDVDCPDCGLRKIDLKGMDE